MKRTQVADAGGEVGLPGRAPRRGLRAGSSEPRPGFLDAKGRVQSKRLSVRSDKARHREDRRAPSGETGEQRRRPPPGVPFPPAAARLVLGSLELEKGTGWARGVPLPTERPHPPSGFRGRCRHEANRGERRDRRGAAREASGPRVLTEWPEGATQCENGRERPVASYLETEAPETALAGRHAVAAEEVSVPAACVSR